MGKYAGSSSLKEGEKDQFLVPFSLFGSYRIHTSLTVYVLIYLSPLTPQIFLGFERLLFSCSPRYSLPAKEIGI